MNVSSSLFNIGQEIEIYYFPDELDFVYQKGSETFMFIFIFLSLLTTIIGFLFIFNKKVQNRLLKSNSFFCRTLTKKN